MFDIDFYMKMNPLRKRLDAGEKMDRDELLATMEGFRNRKPVVYNIETTNACNMRCEMCPRTTMMTRPIETIDRKTFLRVVDQLEPFEDAKWQEWERFVETEYGIGKTDMSENHFFLYIIPKIIQLHGYGDPLLDRNMPEYVRILSEKGMYSYFSCNPANINIKKMRTMLENGLDYIKYSIETVDDVLHKKIRGKASDFSKSYEKIQELLRIKKENGYKTTIIITMLNLNRQNQMREYELLEKAFDGLDVYIYLKSEDQQWYRQDYHGTNSVHWSEYCKHPWMSMTIKSNGEATTCMEDFNNEIVLGDAGKESLADIWNGERYRKLRMDHFLLTKGIKCTAQCDMKLIGNYFSV
jgi:MoaA/NifB/PqqE/SkfB family radical SAM enzyme